MEERAFAALPGKIGTLARCVQRGMRDSMADKPMDPDALMDDANSLHKLADILEGCAARAR